MKVCELKICICMQPTWHIIVFALCRCCVWHRLLQHGWLRSSKAQVSSAKWKPNTSLPWVANHHHALHLLALCQHSAAQLAHSYLQVSPPPTTSIKLPSSALLSAAQALPLFVFLYSFTFEEVQDNTDRIWKFQRYELIKEYHSRPAAPPPFIILSHLYIFIRSVVLCRPQSPCKDFSK